MRASTLCFSKTLTLLTILLIAGSAGATTITVGYQNDNINPTNARCSLREAIIAANTNTASGTVAGECPAGEPGLDVILLTKPVFALAIAGTNEDLGAKGDLDITESVTIKGNIAGTPTTIDAKALDRVFHVMNNAVVVFDNLIITNGDAGPTLAGGGILTATGQVTVRDSIVSGNKAVVGGGGVAVVGSLAVEHSTIRDNLAGGGIRLAGAGSTLNITSSAIVSNTGYGIDNGGTATIISSTIAKNTAVGITNKGSIGLQFVTVSGNNTGIVNSATASIGNSIIVGNTPQPATYDCSGVFAEDILGRNFIGTATENSGLAASSVGYDAGTLLGAYFAGTIPTPPGTGHYLPLTGSPSLNNGVQDLTHKDQLVQPCLGLCDIGAIESLCGNQQVDKAWGEICDDGNLSETDGCRRSCIPAICGDGITWEGVEECDNGSDNSNTGPSACRTSCKKAFCGDGVTDLDEACDDGNTVATDSCTNTCQLPTCGDGLVQGAEVCDDGNATNTDTCTQLCKAPACGDGFVQAGEVCDNGSDNNNTLVNACRTSCQKAHCGDAVIDTAEQCDDGNVTNGDGCSSACATEGKPPVGGAIPTPVADPTPVPPTVPPTQKPVDGDTPTPSTGSTGTTEPAAASGGCNLIQGASL